MTEIGHVKEYSTTHISKFLGTLSSVILDLDHIRSRIAMREYCYNERKLTSGIRLVQSF